MSFSVRSWMVALSMAIASHGLAFLLIKPSDEAKIERSSGPSVTIKGSLSSLATKLKVVSSAQAVEPVTAETVAEVEPEPVLKSVTQVAALSAPTPVTAIEPVTSRAIISAQKIKPVKAVKAVKIQHRRIKPKRKPRKKQITKPRIVKKKVVKKKIRTALLKREKLVRRKIQRKKKANLRKKARARAKARTDAKAKARAKTSRRGGRQAAVHRGGGSRGRQSRVSGRANLSNYKGRIRTRVSGRAQARGHRGSVILRFTITSGGRVRGISVSGGNATIRRIAYKAANGSFPPIPRATGLSSIPFVVRINFR